jgi:putative transposase
MNKALFMLLSDEAKGLSANVVSRLNTQGSEEWQQWDRRNLSTAH